MRRHADTLLNFVWYGHFCSLRTLFFGYNIIIIMYIIE